MRVPIGVLKNSGDATPKSCLHLNIVFVGLAFQTNRQGVPSKKEHPPLLLPNACPEVARKLIPPGPECAMASLLNISVGRAPLCMRLAGRMAVFGKPTGPSNHLGSITRTPATQGVAGIALSGSSFPPFS